MRGECEKVFTLCAEGVIKSDTVRMESSVKNKSDDLIFHTAICL